jgi:hypothetical protein
MLQARTLSAFCLCLFLGAVLVAQEIMHSSAKSTPAFDQLKSLAGNWGGKDSSGSPVKISYKVISNGSVVMEYLEPAKEPEMVTMYSLDCDRIVVTHYCSAGNQPTMQTAPSPAATGKLDFSFVRVSGTKTPDEGHMIALSVSILDKDHLTQTWTFQDHGKSLNDSFSYTRVK